jgi:hypothetical protein
MPQNILVTQMCHIKFLVCFKTSRRQESSVPWHVSTHCPLCYKFWMFCMCSTHQPSLCIVGNSSREPSLIKFSLWALVKFPTHKTDTLLHHGNSSKCKDGACEAARAPGLSPKMPGIHSYSQWAFPRLPRETPTYAQKRWYCPMWRPKWKKLRQEDERWKLCLPNNRYPEKRKAKEE